jgi:hypothetical protein
MLVEVCQTIEVDVVEIDIRRQQLITVDIG